MRVQAAQIERVSYIGATQKQHFYTLQHTAAGMWCSETLDERGNTTSQHGPFPSRGEAIRVAELHIDALSASR